MSDRSGVTSSKQILLAIRRPSAGAPYARCALCRKQVFAVVAPDASLLQIAFQLRTRMDQHHRYLCPGPPNPVGTE